eukprot:TRINITY_DN49517_c0_g1_i1.p1 TRINITY_DN49517_c0_g1~~TRINITY_DN49517_c0_g1_i1.p1  ORF type:complete len:695 (-),score=43.30 TRINITY_DN49517_c0_g1_i1:57-2141(-)
MEIDPEECDVIILGAGPAGIGAARRLLESSADLKAIVVEARNRPGGRAWTSDELGAGIELDHGSKWIHGNNSQNPRNPMAELAKQYSGAAHFGVGGSAGAMMPSQNRTGNMTRIVTTVGGAEAAESFRSVAPDRHFHRAATILHDQLISFGPQSSIRQVAAQGSPEASYKDCLLELARRELALTERPDDAAFEAWLRSRAQLALQQVLQAQGGGHYGASAAPMARPTTSEEDVQQTLALLRLNIYRQFENYEGCRLDQASVWHGLSAPTCLPGRNAVVVGGYGKLVRALVSGPTPIDIRYNQHATSVCTASGGPGATVSATAFSTVPSEESRMLTYRARLGCICAVPLGVLQSATIEFNPPLPEGLTLSLNRMGMCLMNKIELLFPAQWWPNRIGSLTVASSSSSSLSLSMSSGNAGNKSDTFVLGDMPWAHWIVESDNVLVCYATGAFAERVETMTDTEVQREAVEVLRRAFAATDSCIRDIPDAVRAHVTRWRSDPWSRGSWTFYKAGTRGVEDVSAFQQFNAENQNASLYFAGEHTCDGSVGGLDIGTVHGAYTSGRKAAEELLRKNPAKLTPRTCVDNTSIGAVIAAPGTFSRPLTYVVYRHFQDQRIPRQAGYTKGRRVQVTRNADDIIAEFQCDPQEVRSIGRVNAHFLGQMGVIRGVSCWGWVLVEFPAETQLEARYFTPFCLLLEH